MTEKHLRTATCHSSSNAHRSGDGHGLQLTKRETLTTEQSAKLETEGKGSGLRRPFPTSERLSYQQAKNLMDGLGFARKLGTPLNAHATINWEDTDAGGDPDGRRFARVREGFDKWLLRRGIRGGLTCIWVREKTSDARGGTVHCHMLFHLPHPFTTGRKRIEVEDALERLIARHGGGKCLDQASEITEPDEPDGIYFLKGGGPDVWDEFDVPCQWRTAQGKIYGKRCGFTENIGPTARGRWNSP